MGKRILSVWPLQPEILAFLLSLDSDLNDWLSCFLSFRTGGLGLTHLGFQTAKGRSWTFLSSVINGTCSSQ